MPLRDVPRQLFIDQLLLDNSVTNLARASAFAWGVPIQPIYCTVLGSWVMPTLRSFVLCCGQTLQQLCRHVLMGRLLCQRSGHQWATQSPQCSKQ